MTAGWLRRMPDGTYIDPAEIAALVTPADGVLDVAVILTRSGEQIRVHDTSLDEVAALLGVSKRERPCEETHDGAHDYGTTGRDRCPCGIYR